MTTVVVPFAGSRGKTRLDAPSRTRRELSLAMLADVLAATVAVGPTLVVTSDPDGAALALEVAAEPVEDPGGGAGGGRFVQGAVDVVGARDVTVVGTVGDDLEVLGLHVSPDLDSVLYALSGLNDEGRGWGRAGETWRALETVASLGGEAWFRLGDLDLGLHLVRTAALRAGEPLSRVTARLAAELGVETGVLPATDDRLRTWIAT